MQLTVAYLPLWQLADRHCQQHRLPNRFASSGNDAQQDTGAVLDNLNLINNGLARRANAKSDSLHFISSKIRFARALLRKEIFSSSGIPTANQLAFAPDSCQ